MAYAKLGSATLAETQLGWSVDLTGQTGSYSITGQAGAMALGHQLDGYSSTLTLTGQSGTLALGAEPVGSYDALADSGFAGSLSIGYDQTVTTGTVSITGNAGYFSTGVERLSSGAGTLTLVSQDGTVQHGHIIDGVYGILTKGDFAGTVSVGNALDAASTNQLNVTGYSGSNQVLSVAKLGSGAILGKTPLGWTVFAIADTTQTLNYSLFGAGSYALGITSIAGDTTTYSVAGYPADLTHGNAIDGALGSVTLNGLVGDLVNGHVLDGQTGYIVDTDFSGNLTIGNILDATSHITVTLGGLQGDVTPTMRHLTLIRGGAQSTTWVDITSSGSQTVNYQ